MYIFTFSRPAKRLLHYGLFAVICHTTAILFLALLHTDSSGAFLYHKFFPMIEHSLVSFIAVLLGALGIEYVRKEREK